MYSMISFKSKDSAIRKAERIMLHAKSVYPHVSESKSAIKISDEILFCDNDFQRAYKLSVLKRNNETKMYQQRANYGKECAIMGWQIAEKIGHSFKKKTNDR